MCKCRRMYNGKNDKWKRTSSTTDVSLFYKYTKRHWGHEKDLVEKSSYRKEYCRAHIANVAVSMVIAFFNAIPNKVCSNVEVADVVVSIVAIACKVKYFSALKLRRLLKIIEHSPFLIMNSWLARNLCCVIFSSSLWPNVTLDSTSLRWPPGYILHTDTSDRHTKENSTFWIWYCKLMLQIPFDCIGSHLVIRGKLKFKLIRHQDTAAHLYCRTQCWTCHCWSGVKTWLIQCWSRAPHTPHQIVLQHQKTSSRWKNRNDNLTSLRWINVASCIWWFTMTKQSTL